MASKLADPTRGRLEAPRRFTGREAQSQRLGDPPLAGRMPREPGGKVHAKGDLFGHRGFMIFDDRFLPFIGVGIEFVEPFHDDALSSASWGFKLPEPKLTPPLKPVKDGALNGT